MKLWILKARGEELPPDDNPWDAEFDMNYCLVLRAETEERARRLAQDKSQHESDTGKPWLDVKYTTCHELAATGDEEVICVDFKNG